MPSLPRLPPASGWRVRRRNPPKSRCAGARRGCCDWPGRHPFPYRRSGPACRSAGPTGNWMVRRRRSCGWPGRKSAAALPKARWNQINSSRATRSPSMASRCWVTKPWVARLPSTRRAWNRLRMPASGSRWRLSSWISSTCVVMASNRRPACEAWLCAMVSPSWRSLISVRSETNTYSAVIASRSRTASC